MMICEKDTCISTIIAGMIVVLDCTFTNI